MNKQRLITIQAALLGLWSGVLAMAGVSAALIFPGMKKLDPALPDYAGYEGDHWLIAAGDIAARQFHVLAYIEPVIGLFVFGTVLMLLLRDRPLGIALAFRSAAVGGAIGLLLFQAFILQPRMDGNMALHREAALRGDDAAALAAKQAFDADHPTASGVMQARLGLLIVALTLVCASRRAGKLPEAAS